jgi:Head domain of trimeric autotransporter adhesin
MGDITMSRVLNRSFASAIAIAVAAQFAPASAQIVVNTIPLGTTCTLPSPTNITQCVTEVLGTQTVTTNSQIVTPIPGGSNVVTTGNVDFDGLLQIQGLRLHGLPFAASIFFSPEDFANITADLATNYDFVGDLNSTASGFQFNPATNFTINSLNLRAINFSQADVGFSNPDGSFGSYNLSATDPSAIVMGGTALSGNFRSAFDSPGPIQFGRLTGTATLLSGTIMTDPSGGGLSYLSPFGLDVQVTQTVTTQIDENGILTDTLTVSSGRINTGNQVIIGNGSSSGGGQTVSIGVGNVATGDGAVAIGDPNIATGQGAVAIGADNTATGQGAVALGNLNNAIGRGAVAIGDMAAATTDGSIAIGVTAVGTGSSATAVGNFARALGDASSAFGRATSASGTQAVAVGDQASTSGLGNTSVGSLS